MKAIISNLTILSLLCFSNIYSQTFQWALSANSDDVSGAFGVDYDAAGNCYAVGEYKGGISYGSYNLNTTLSEMYIVKINPAGVPQWLVSSASVGFNSGAGGWEIAVDAAGNSYVTGYFAGTVSFGNFTFTSNGNEDIFIAKYNSAGVNQWAVQVGDTSKDFGLDIDIDNSGNCYVTGTFRNIVYFGSTQLTSNGQADVFVAKYSPLGSLQWVTSGGGPDLDEVTGITQDVFGNSIITGRFGISATYGSINLSAISVDVFVVKFDPAGTPVWGISEGGTGISEGKDISCDANGNIYVTGYFSSVANFGGITMANTAPFNMFFAKYNSSGNIFWVKSSGNTQYDWGYGINADPSGNIYVSGYFTGLSTFGSVTINGGPSNLFLVKLNTHGVGQYGKKAIMVDYESDVSADASGNVYVAGRALSGVLTFDTHVLFPNSLGYESFVAKIDAASNLISGKVFIDYNNNGTKESNEPNYPNSIISLTPGNTFTTTNSIGDYYFSTGIGTYNTNIFAVPAYYSATPLTHVSNFTALNQTSPNKNFPLYPYISVNDLSIIITNNWGPQINKNSKLYVTIKNVGTNIQSGSATLTYDNIFNYVSSLTSPLPDNVSGNNLTWNFTNLNPLESKTFIAGVFTPLSTPLNTVLTSTGLVNPVSGDANPVNNYYTLLQTVDETFPPNYKSVQAPNLLTPQNIANGDSLIYTIRFQNTGTSTVNNIIVTDVLSSKLNTASFQMLDASHPYSYIIQGPGTVEWTFANILLPPIISDEPKSHGFIKYCIKPINTLVPGDTIENKASIFFGNNPAIVTNTTKTPVIQPPTLMLSYNLQVMNAVFHTTTVFLRESLSPFTNLDSCSNQSLSITPNGYFAEFEFLNVPENDSFYIVVKHRNSIETWSSNPARFTENNLFYDFTSSPGQAYGENMILVNGSASFYSGDVDQDGVIDGTDNALIGNDAEGFVTGNVITDLNGDEFVDGSDFLVADNNSANFIHVIRP